MNRLNLRNNRLKFKTPGKLPTNLEESMEYTSNYEEKTERSHHVSSWTLEIWLGFWKPIMLKNLPGHSCESWSSCQPPDLMEQSPSLASAWRSQTCSNCSFNFVTMSLSSRFIKSAKPRFFVKKRETGDPLVNMWRNFQQLDYCPEQIWN